MIIILGIRAYFIDVAAKHQQRGCRYCIAIVNNGMLIHLRILCAAWFHVNNCGLKHSCSRREILAEVKDELGH